MIKRKGQIVPRYLVECYEPKSRHLVKFGCDVEIIGRKITALTYGYVIDVPYLTHVNKKKRQCTVKGFLFNDITIIGMGHNSKTFRVDNDFVDCFQKVKL